MFAVACCRDRARRAISGEALADGDLAVPFIYRHIGARSKASGLDVTESRLSLRPDLRSPNGLYGAPLAVLLQDLAWVTIVRLAPLVVPIQINVRIRQQVPDATELFAVGQTNRRGRALQATEAPVYERPTTRAWSRSWRAAGPR